MQPVVDFDAQFQLQGKLKQIEFDMEDKRTERAAKAGSRGSRALEFRQVELRLQLEIEQHKVLQVQGQPPVQRQHVFSMPTASKLVPR